MVKTTIENSKYAASLLLIEGNYEYFKILDNNLADVMNKNITAEEAAKRIEAELEQDHQRDRPGPPDPDLAQGRRERHLSRQVLSRDVSAPIRGATGPQRLSRPGSPVPMAETQHRASQIPTRRMPTRRSGAAPLRAVARLRARVPPHPVPARRGAVRPDHPGALRPDDLDQPAEVARQPSVRDGPLRRPRELRGSAHQRSVLAGARAHLLFRRRRRRARAGRRLRAGDARVEVHAIAEALYHHLPGADDDRADRRRLQLLHDLYRQRAAQPDPGPVPGAVRHRPAHPLAVASDRRAVGDHHRRHLAVDVPDLPDLPVRLRGACRVSSSTRPA